MTDVTHNVDESGHIDILGQKGGGVAGGSRDTEEQGMEIQEDEDFPSDFDDDGNDDPTSPTDNGPRDPQMPLGGVNYEATEATYNPKHDQAPTEPPPDAPQPPSTRTAPEILRDIWARWFPGREPGDISWSGLDNIASLYSTMGIDPTSRPTQEIINQKFKEACEEVAAVLNDLDRIGMLSRDNNDAMLRLILQKLEAARQVLLGSCLLCKADTMQPSDLPRDEFGLWRFLPADITEDESPSPRQRLIIYCLGDCMRSGFRRYKEWFMERIYTPEGRPTCAWGASIKIADYVRSLTSRRLTNPRIWFDLTAAAGISAMKGLTEYLTYSNDPEIPWLEPDRHVFSFSNGVYLAKEERFISYDVMHHFYSGASYPVACKHFEINFDPAWLSEDDPMNIPTPAMDSIFELQQLSPNVRRWTYALMGRMLYNVREFDDWQIFLFLKGLANTGKSTLLNYIKQLYDAQDVGTISNMVEKQFGLGLIAGKFIGIADDVRQSFQMDQSDFQNMASGNAVPCAIKHKDAFIVDPWITPLLFSGNEPPGYHDNSGSYGRRMAVVAFNFMVTNPDGSLSEKLKMEQAAFIAKINRQYRNMVRRWGHIGIWNILPEEFKTQRAELTATSNALIGLLSSASVRKGPKLYMPLDILRAAVMNHAQRNNLVRPQWGGDYYRGPLTSEGLKLDDKVKKKYYPRHSKTRIEDIYVMGVDLAVNCVDGAAPSANGADVFALPANGAPMMDAPLGGGGGAPPPLNPRKRQRILAPMALAIQAGQRPRPQ